MRELKFLFGQTKHIFIVRLKCVGEFVKTAGGIFRVVISFKALSQRAQQILTQEICGFSRYILNA